jgi:predicted peptidase
MRHWLSAFVVTVTLSGMAFAASNNADLDVLGFRVTGGAELVPPFSKETSNYEVRVNSDIKVVQVRAAPWTSRSKLTLNGEPIDNSLIWYRVNVNPGDNPITIAVQAPDNQTSKKYTITVKRADDKPIADAFQKFVYTDTGSGLKMPYRLFIPSNYDQSKSYPLVLFLHGGGENGDDNEKQLHGTEGATVWAEPAEQAKRPAFVLAPQARAYFGGDPKLPIGGFGITRNRDSERYMDEVLTPSSDVRLALRILERVLGEYNIDRKRVYVTGLSQGGFGTWNISLLRPDLFAAMIPIAGGGDPTQMGKLVNKPIWAFHAEDDPVIPVTYSRNSINALRQMGGHPMYTELPSGTFFEPNEHFSWVYAYKNEAVREWLFKQALP